MEKVWLLSQDINEKNAVVLCVTKNDFVTWVYNKEFDSYGWGNHFKKTAVGLESAVKDFNRRVNDRLLVKGR